MGRATNLAWNCSPACKVCAPFHTQAQETLLTSLVRKCGCILTRQQTLSKLLCPHSSLCCLSNSPHRLSRSLFPFPSSNTLFIPMFMGFLPSCAWSINQAQDDVIYNNKSSSLLVPEATPWAHAVLIKQHRWMAFSNGGKLLQFRPSLACVSCVSNFGWWKELTVYVTHKEVSFPNPQKVSF